MLLVTPLSGIAAELGDLQKVIDHSLEVAIEQFPGGTTIYSTRRSPPLYELHDWQSLSLLLFDTEPIKERVAQILIQ